MRTPATGRNRSRTLRSPRPARQNRADQQVCLVHRVGSPGGAIRPSERCGGPVPDPAATGDAPGDVTPSVRRSLPLSQLAPPPGLVGVVRSEDPRPVQDRAVQRPYERAQFAGALPGQGVDHVFEVVAEVPRAAPASGDTARIRRKRLGEPAQRPVRQSLPLREGLSRRLRPVAAQFEPAEVGRAGGGEPVDRGTAPPVLPVLPPDGGLAPQGGGAPTRHCPFGCRSWEGTYRSSRRVRRELRGPIRSLLAIGRQAGLVECVSPAETSETYEV